MTTETAASSDHSTFVSASFPSTQASMTSTRSLFKSGSTTCVSGSPNRALNSTTFGPFAVIISPAYKQPLKGRPSFFMPSMVGFRISSITRSRISGVMTGAGA